MDYRPGKLRDYVRAQMAPRVAAVAEGLADLMVAKVSTPGPPRSKGGTPPHIDTLRKSGRHLYESIGAYHQVEDKAVYSDVGTNLPHGLYTDQGTMRMAARPWCLETLKEERPYIARGLGVAS